MALVVQKFGGTSVGSIERIRNVARRCLAAQRAGNDVVVIVSAMSGETNRLLGLAHEVTEVPDAREMDAIAATGEQVAAALTAMAIQNEGGKARSLLGHQVKILTDGAFNKARIKAIEGSKIFSTVREGQIAVVAGFQGVDEKGDITTLGRGGSDTTAVAVAAAIGADACEIYTDVAGVYTTDPNVCPTARKIARISYEEMLELASLGAKVLQIRSVEIAMKYGVPVHVRTSFNESEGTWVTREDKTLEDVVVAGVAYDKGEARVSLVGLENKVGAMAELFAHIADKNISVDMIVQTADTESAGRADVTFTLPKVDFARAKTEIEAIAKSLGARDIRCDSDVVKVSIVGLGMRSHAGIASKMFRLLAKENIPIQAVSTSEIKVSVLVPAKYTELAVRTLHDGFGLAAATS
ncbi:MAG TPA: aspartate kinase [Polyangiaceae bacterium]